MNILHTLSDLQRATGQELLFPARSISIDSVAVFGKLTGDWNNHNTQPTETFQKPAVQGFLSLSLFADFHKQVCKIENADPINVQVVEAKFLRPVYVDESFTPALTITAVEQKKDFIQVFWKYELRHVDTSKKLVTAVLEIRYYQKK